MVKECKEVNKFYLHDKAACAYARLGPRLYRWILMAVRRLTTVCRTDRFFFAYGCVRPTSINCPQHKVLS
ncbi:hypothetical protein Y032_0006g3060 [Ancylostoma ceylanicum]|uniref:Uncharacterized protein n=1 Tax=Ancylostoma ceylanicum TaxID=53326 RepID=A0A016VPW3_9BILA|nr:hypothetical protein Y032_0006g3060 [Ancylostoma ceylanicum]